MMAMVLTVLRNKQLRDKLGNDGRQRGGRGDGTQDDGSGNMGCCAGVISFFLSPVVLLGSCEVLKT